MSEESKLEEIKLSDERLDKKLDEKLNSHLTAGIFTVGMISGSTILSGTNSNQLCFQSTECVAEKVVGWFLIICGLYMNILFLIPYMYKNIVKIQTFICFPNTQYLINIIRNRRRVIPTEDETL